VVQSDNATRPFTSAMCRPAGHSAHSVCVPGSAYLPTAQSSHGVVATESASYRPAAHVAHSPSRGPRSHSAAGQHSHVIRDSCELHSCKMCYAASA
jgi:hypothetical protein